MSNTNAVSPCIWKFFPKIETIPASKKKRFFSTFGLSNPSAESYFLADYVHRTKPSHVFFILERKSEIFEYQHLFAAFLGDEYDIFTFSVSSDEKVLEKEKFLFAKILAEKKKTIFLLSREQADFLFPHQGVLIKKQLIIEKNTKIQFATFFDELGAAGYKSAFDQQYLEEGEFIRIGDTLKIFPLGAKSPIVVETEFNEITSLYFQGIGADITPVERIKIFPIGGEESMSPLWDIVTSKDLLFIEEFSDLDESVQKNLLASPARIIESSAFPKYEEDALHLRFLSILRFYTLPDFLNDLREKIIDKWKILIVSKRYEELSEIFLEEGIPFTKQCDTSASVALHDATDADFVPPSFQNPSEKILFLTDREIFHIKSSKKKSATEPDMMDFLTSLRPGDYVVHLDHGIGRFLGISEQEISNIMKEYLEIEYLGNDKLFVPIAYADKISRYITDEDSPPRLTRLGGNQWEKTQRRAKEETEKIAKELLNVYAQRARASATACENDTEKMKSFEASFPYTPTPGQVAAIRDIKKDLEMSKPMDRLVCGDVGFGKTEVAMRAAFKAVESGMQVAVIAPITILVDQHYKSFKSRMDEFGINVEMISRFRSPKEQKEILERLKKGKIDILIGTHRLLSGDVKFDNLGLLIIDEEQRFGVQQKEKLKSLREDVHILTMTATPIPRTLNLALHKLREISTITTPPPGRLPVITEVRKYSDKLIRDAILQEIKRGGQIYFLHNRVETIEGITDKLRHLVPEARFEVAHGQLSPHKLEKKIIDFKAHKFDVLVSSTIVENGIDLANANTMIINHAEKFGLSQLYQLRGRIGRSSRQAYAYLMYSSQKLPIDAKKRLRAIVEASELGSGFQLSMRDLEIRGAGDVLGVSQHGSVNSVGVNHFLRLLKKTITQLENKEKNAGKKEEIEVDVQIEIPLSAFIPSFYIPDNKEKILAYQRFARTTDLESLQEISDTLEEEYGRLTPEVKNLVNILKIKILAKKSGLTSVRFQDDNVELAMGKSITAKEIMNLLAIQPKWAIIGSTLVTEQIHMGVDFVATLLEAIELLQKKGK